MFILRRRQLIRPPLAALSVGAGASLFEDQFLTPPAGINAAPDGSNQYTFGNITGIVSDDRCVVVITCSTNGGTTCSHDSLTANAGAITFTRIGQSPTANSTNKTSLWVAAVPSETQLTAPILTCSAAPARGGISGAWAHGRGTATSDTIVNTSSNSGSIDVPASGLLIVAHHNTGSAGNTATWTGLDDADGDIISSPLAGAMYTSAGRYTNTGGAESGRAISVSWDLTGGNDRMIAASFGAQEA